VETRSTLRLARSLALEKHRARSVQSAVNLVRILTGSLWRPYAIRPGGIIKDARQAPQESSPCGESCGNLGAKSILSTIFIASLCCHCSTRNKPPFGAGPPGCGKKARLNPGTCFQLAINRRSHRKRLKSKPLHAPFGQVTSCYQFRQSPTCRSGKREAFARQRTL